MNNGHMVRRWRNISRIYRKSLEIIGVLLRFMTEDAARWQRLLDRIMSLANVLV